MPKEETIEIMKLSNAFVAKTGITTNAGHWSGNTLVDTIGITEWDDYWKNMKLVIIDGNNKGLARRIMSSTQSTGTLTVYPIFPYAIDNGVTYKIISDVTVSGDVSGTTLRVTYNHPNDTNENIAIELGTSNGSVDINVRLDLNNITQTMTIREYEKVDGTNYRQLSAKIFPTDFDTGTKIVETNIKATTNGDYKITFQSGIAEGSIKTIPYETRTQVLY